MDRADFFAHIFGFSEKTDDYDDTQQRLLTMADFSDRSIAVPAAAGHAPTSDSSSSSPSASDPIRIEKERCVLHMPHHQQRGGGDHQLLSCGTFSTPSVHELRRLVSAALEDQGVQQMLAAYREGPSTTTTTTSRHQHIINVVGDSRALHSLPEYRDAVFQAASQFNYLEFPSPRVTPEHGITGYIYDPTQGPACAVACAAGTMYRNYLARVDPATLTLQGAARRADAPTTTKTTSARTTNNSDDQETSDQRHESVEQQQQERGQRAYRQFNGLKPVEDLLLQYYNDNSSSTARNSCHQTRSFVDVRNGYVDSDKNRLQQLNQVLLQGEQQQGGRGRDTATTDLREAAVGAMRIGIEESTPVTDVSPFTATTTTGDMTGDKNAHKRYDNDNIFAANDRDAIEQEKLPSPHLVTQTYNSALSINYSHVSSESLWQPLAQVVLDATYEATMLVAILNNIGILRRHYYYYNGQQQGSPAASPPPLPRLPPVVLTKVGGGVFGNKSTWIKAAIRRACLAIGPCQVPLAIHLSHFGRVDAEYAEFVERTNKELSILSTTSSSSSSL